MVKKQKVLTDCSGWSMKKFNRFCNNILGKAKKTKKKVLKNEKVQTINEISVTEWTNKSNRMD